MNFVLNILGNLLKIARGGNPRFTIEEDFAFLIGMHILENISKTVRSPHHRGTKYIIGISLIRNRFSALRPASALSGKEIIHGVLACRVGANRI